MEFSEKLQELRKSRSMTQEELQRVSEHRLAKRDIPLFLRND